MRRLWRMTQQLCLAMFLMIPAPTVKDTCLASLSMPAKIVRMKDLPLLESVLPAVIIAMRYIEFIYIL